MDTLYQKKLFFSRRFTIKGDSVEVENKSLSKIVRYSVKLEKLGFEIQYHRKNDLIKKILIIGSIIVLIGITLIFFATDNKFQQSDFESLFVFYIIATGVIITMLITEYADDIYLLGNTNLIFYRNSPDENTVRAFINDLNGVTKKFLKDKYTDFDEATTAEEFYNCIQWLYNKEIITRQEYIDYKASFDMQKLL